LSTSTDRNSAMKNVGILGAGTGGTLVANLLSR
jgi:hypothetical protein